ncbi:hypothetical protein OSTOST_06669 [Ostertagia ostertagi]
MLYNDELELPKLRDVNDKRKLYAMKVEKQRGCERPVLKLDVAVLSQMRNTVGFPTLIVAGRTELFKMSLTHGPSSRFTQATAYRIALQTLDRLEKLHDAGYLNRDVKSQNFAVGLGNESSIIYMLDFGLTRRFKRNTTETSSMWAMCWDVSVLTTSISNNEGSSAEGRFGGLVLHGCLPWYNAKTSPDHGLTREWKQYARGTYKSEMLSTLPSEFTPIFNKITATRFEERPRYQFIQRMVLASVTRQGINLNVPYDWQTVPSLLSLVEKSVMHDPIPQSAVTAVDMEGTAVEMQPTVEEAFDTNQSIAVLT